MKLIKLLPLLGIGIFIYLIYRIGINNIIDVFKNINYFYLFLLIFLAFLIVILQTYKWGLILKKQNINLKFYSLFKIQMISFLYGSITPGRVGSLIKVSYLKKRINKNYGESSSSVILERAIDFLVLFLFASFGAFLLINYFSNLFWELIILVLLMFLSFIFIFLNRKRARFFLKFIHIYLIPRKYKEKLSNLFHSFYDGILKPKQLIKPFIVSLFIWFCIYLQAYIAALALSINEVPYYYFFGLFPLASIVGLIPITIGGVGTREMTLIGLFIIVGYNIPNKILAISLLWSFTSLIINGVGLYYTLKEHKNG